jgi:hypothetical protein
MQIASASGSLEKALEGNGTVFELLQEELI